MAEDLREAAERLAMGYAVAGVRNRHQKCILDMSPEAERLLGGEFRLHIVAMDEEGRLVQCSVTTVSRKAAGAEKGPETSRGSARYLGAHLSARGGGEGGPGRFWEEQDVVARSVLNIRLVGRCGRWREKRSSFGGALEEATPRDPRSSSPSSSPARPGPECA